MDFSQGISRKGNARVPLVITVLVDILLINAGFMVAYWLRFLGDVPRYNIEPFVNMIPWLSMATALIFMGLGLYEKQRNGFLPVLRASVTGVICVVIASTVIAFWLRGFSFPRSVLVLSIVVQAAFIVPWRFACWYLEKRLHGLKDLLVIGPRSGVEKMLEKVLDLPGGWFRVKKVLEPSSIDRLNEWMSEVDSIMLVPSLPEKEKAWAVAACQGAGREVFVVPDFYDILIGNARVAQLDDLPVMEIQDISLTGAQRMVKRAVDIAVSSAVLVVTSPLMLASMFMIKITSPGPVFFAQRRVGRGGRIFYLCKFRTMVPNAEQLSGPVLAADNDPRVTSVGKILRVTRLDELPQLFNVLKGEMSFVGPRPERPVFVEEFHQEYPDYNYRHLVKPGITGFAQVMGKYTTSPKDKLRFDLYYIRNYSIFLDLKIILQTIPVLLSRESSAGKKDDREEKQARIHHLVNEAAPVQEKTVSRDRPG